MAKQKNPESFVGKEMYLDIGRDVIVTVLIKSVKYIFGRWDAEVKIIGAKPAEISVKFDNLIPIDHKQNERRS